MFISQWVMHRDPRYFAEPERSARSAGTTALAKRCRSYAYFPFGGGPRICIGNHFALMEARLLLAAIAQRFRLELVPDQRIALQPSITLRPRYGLRVTLQRRPPVEGAGRQAA